MTPEEIADRFTYHAPSSQGVTRHEALSLGFINLATLVEKICPEGREKSLVMTKLEEAKFWASAGVARNAGTR